MNIRLVLLLIRVVLLIIQAGLLITVGAYSLLGIYDVVYALVTAPEWHINTAGWMLAAAIAAVLYVSFPLSRKFCHRPLSPTHWS